MCLGHVAFIALRRAHPDEVFMRRNTIGGIGGALLILGLAVGGCGGDDGGDGAKPSGSTGGSGGSTSNPNLAPALDFVSDEMQTLQFGQTVDLAVRYYDLNTQTAIAGEQISYAIAGDTAGSQLGALMATTDAAGEARVSFIAGQQNGTVSVEVSPPAGGGSPIAFQIVISDVPVGSIAVSMAYLGELPLEHLLPQLYRGVSCSGLDPDALPVPIGTTDPPLSSINDTTSWSALEVGTDYAVTVTGNVGPNVRAFGCVDAVAVEQSMNTDVPVALADLDWPGPVLGTYELVNQLDFGGKLPGSVQTSVNLLAELTDDDDVDCNTSTQDYGQDPGAFLTDFVMRQTCHWECLSGEDFDTCSEIDHGYGDLEALCTNNMMTWDGGQPKFFGGCGSWEVGAPWLQDQINAYVAQHVPGGVLAFAEMAGDIARAINQAKIYSELNVQEGSDTSQPMTHRLVQMEVLLHDMNGAEHTFLFELADAGLTSLQTNSAISVDGTDVTIPEHEFNLSYGKLVQYIYVNGLLPLFGFSSTGGMFASWVDCASVGQWLALNVAWVPMSAQGWKSFCDSGIQLAGDTFDNQLAGTIEAEGVLSLEGTCVAADIDPITNIASTLSNGQWVGSWNEVNGGSGDISGTFEGTLQ